VVEVAAAVGYGSETAFNPLFKWEFDCPQTHFHLKHSVLAGAHYQEGRRRCYLHHGNLWVSFFGIRVASVQTTPLWLSFPSGPLRLHPFCFEGIQSLAGSQLQGVGQIK
jgi:hypothetical protein